MNRIYRILTTMTPEQNEDLVAGYTDEQLAEIEAIDEFVISSEEYSFITDDGHILEYIITTPEIMDRISSFGDKIGQPIQVTDVTDEVGGTAQDLLRHYLKNTEH